MSSVLFDVPESHVAEFRRILTEEFIGHEILDSREGVFEIVHTVEVHGNEKKVEWAYQVLNRLQANDKVSRKYLNVLSKDYIRVIRLAKENHLGIVRDAVSLSLFGFPLLHRVILVGFDDDHESFKKSK